jgi:hypothetical protein
MSEPKIDIYNHVLPRAVVPTTQIVEILKQQTLADRRRDQRDQYTIAVSPQRVSPTQ